MATTATLDEIYQILYTDVRDPFKVLGAHIINHDGKKIVSVRAYLPEVESAYVIATEEGDKEYLSGELMSISFHPSDSERFVFYSDGQFMGRVKF